MRNLSQGLSLAGFQMRPFASLAQQALSAIRRNGGTLLLPGASTPVLGEELIPSMDLSAWVSGGAFGNWTGTTATADTITTTGVNGSRRIRLACTPGTTYWFSARVTGGTGVGSVAIAFGTSAAVYITHRDEAFVAGGTVVGALLTAPANAAFVEFCVRGGTTGQTATFAEFRSGVFSGYTHGNPPLRNYLDSAGTDLLDSVTQVDKPVGLALDSMGVLGEELVTDPSFDDPSNWSPGDGWAVTGGNAVATAAAASTNMIPAAAGCAATVAAKTYVAEVVIQAISGGVNLIIWNGSTNLATTSIITAPGTYQLIYTANNTQCRPYLSAQGASTTLTAASLSQKEIPGNHATQPTTASKPILRRTDGRWSWQFDGSNDFLQTGITTGNEGWVCAGVTPVSLKHAGLISNGGTANTNAGVRMMLRSNGDVWLNTSNGTGLSNASAVGAYSAGVPQVFDGGWKVGQNVFIAVNGVEVAGASTVNPTSSTGLYLGCNFDSAVGDYTNGPMTAVVYCPVLPSPADRALIRRFVGSLQGQTL